MPEPTPFPATQTTSKHYGCRGAVTGGCLLPVLLFIAAAASGDTGGPLFWPILCVFLGIIGFVVGLFVRSSFSQSMSSPRAQFADHDSSERQLFISLAADLSGLLGAASTFGQTSTKWQSQADRLRERLDGIYAPIYPRIPHDIEHYLDDSDIRQRDVDYRATQERAVRSYIESWTTELT